jgi:prophage regulatory protein
MNKLESEYINNSLEQLSQRADSTIRELQLLQKHIIGFKAQLKNKKISGKTRAQTPLQPLSIENHSKRAKQPSDLIRIKEVMAMTGVSRSFIHVHLKDGAFPEPICLSRQSISWVRSSVEKWIQSKINTDYLVPGEIFNRKISIKY